MEVLLIGNDQAIEVNGLKDEFDDSYINDATVNVTIKHQPDNTNVVGQTWPLTLTPTGTNGNYSGVLLDAMTLIENARYNIEVTADAGINRIGFWKFFVYARYRRPQQ